MIEEKEELEKLVDSLKNGSRASDASPSIHSKNTRTPEDIGVRVDVLLPVECTTPSSTTVVYELGDVQFGSPVVTELLEQQVSISSSSKQLF